MRVKMLDGANQTVIVNDAYGLRLIEQGLAVQTKESTAKKPAKSKAADAE